jgi:single-strand DNA-binding protein
MQSITIIGNLTKDPETRSTQTGKEVCNFTVAVNRRGKDQEADFFRVAVWDKAAANCQKYLAKGRKVCVVGSVSVRAYQDSNGNPAATMEILARDVEFLSPKEGSNNNGYTVIQNDDDNPFGG